MAGWLQLTDKEILQYLSIQVECTELMQKVQVRDKHTYINHDIIVKHINYKLWIKFIQIRSIISADILLWGIWTRVKG